MPLETRDDRRAFALVSLYETLLRAVLALQQLEDADLAWSCTVRFGRRAVELEAGREPATLSLLDTGSLVTVIPAPADEQTLRSELGQSLCWLLDAPQAGEG